MNVLDLFSGIGGFSLGLEAAGFKTVAFCEIEPYPIAVLQKNWPDVPIYKDVKTLTKDKLDADGISVDVICGGFPCQDISLAGKGAGLEGERSGLWFEFHRLIKEIRPQYAIIENVSALRSRGLDEVLRSLAEIGYDAEWHCIPASAVGAPHQRDRIWIVGYPSSLSGGQQENRNLEWSVLDKIEWDKISNPIVRPSGNDTHHMADTNSTHGKRGSLSSGIYKELSNIISTSRWEIEPNVGRVANGVPFRSHRLKALGNAVVPQIPEIIGKAIIENK